MYTTYLHFFFLNRRDLATQFSTFCTESQLSSFCEVGLFFGKSSLTKYFYEQAKRKGELLRDEFRSQLDFLEELESLTLELLDFWCEDEIKNYSLTLSSVSYPQYTNYAATKLKLIEMLCEAKTLLILNNYGVSSLLLRDSNIQPYQNLSKQNFLKTCTSGSLEKDQIFFNDYILYLEKQLNTITYTNAFLTNGLEQAPWAPAYLIGFESLLVWANMLGSPNSRAVLETVGQNLNEQTKLSSTSLFDLIEHTTGERFEISSSLYQFKSWLNVFRKSLEDVLNNQMAIGNIGDDFTDTITGTVGSLTYTTTMNFSALWLQAFSEVSALASEASQQSITNSLVVVSKKQQVSNSKSMKRGVSVKRGTEVYPSYAAASRATNLSAVKIKLLAANNLDGWSLA
jgi:hypothetical protein